MGHAGNRSCRSTVDWRRGKRLCFRVSNDWEEGRRSGRNVVASIGNRRSGFRGVGAAETRRKVSRSWYSGTKIRLWRWWRSVTFCAGNSVGDVLWNIKQHVIYAVETSYYVYLTIYWLIGILIDWFADLCRDDNHGTVVPVRHVDNSCTQWMFWKHLWYYNTLIDQKRRWYPVRHASCFVHILSRLRVLIISNPFTKCLCFLGGWYGDMGYFQLELI